MTFHTSPFNDILAGAAEGHRPTARELDDLVANLAPGLTTPLSEVRKRLEGITSTAAAAYAAGDRDTARSTVIDLGGALARDFAADTPRRVAANDGAGLNPRDLVKDLRR